MKNCRKDRQKVQYGKVNRSVVLNMPLKGKPPCPYCKKPLGFIYEDAEGHINQKCPNCGRTSWVDLSTMTVYEITEDASGF